MTQQLEHVLQVVADSMVAEADLCVGTQTEAQLHSFARAFRNASFRLRDERKEREAKVNRKDGDVTYDPKGKP